MATCNVCKHYEALPMNPFYGRCMAPLPLYVVVDDITTRAGSNASECEVFKRDLEEADGNV